MIKKIILLNILCLSLNAQSSIQFNARQTVSGQSNGVATLDNGHAVVSGYLLDQNGLIERRIWPNISIVDAEGNTLDTVSFPQYESIIVVGQRYNGRVLCVSKLSDEFTFVTVDRNMQNIILNKSLLSDPLVKLESISSIKFEGEEIEMIIKGEDNNGPGIKRVFYNKQTLKISKIETDCIDKFDFPEYGCYICKNGNSLNKYDLQNNLTLTIDIFSYASVNDIEMNDQGEIYLAASVETSNKYNAVIARYSADGHKLTQKTVTVESNPEFWNFRLAYNSLFKIDGNILAVGVDNYNYDGTTGNFNLILGYYDNKLNTLNFSRPSLGGIRGRIEDILIDKNMKIHGILGAGGGHTSLAHYFNISISSSTNTINLSKKELTIFPNPVGNQLHISSSQEIEKIIILDIHGKILISPKSHKNIDVSTLQKGTYLISMLYQNKNITKYFIKI